HPNEPTRRSSDERGRRRHVRLLPGVSLDRRAPRPRRRRRRVHGPRGGDPAEGMVRSRHTARDVLGDGGPAGRRSHDAVGGAVGVNDWEWILAFESDNLARIVDCLRRLREAEARSYTKEEVPFVTGIRKGFVEAIADIV